MRLSDRDWRKPRNYRRYLRSDDWKAKRQEVLRRQDWCAACGSTENLVCHHFTYERSGLEKPKQLLVLCSDDHDGVHELQKRSKLPLILATAAYCNLSPLKLYSKAYGKRGPRLFRKAKKRYPDWSSHALDRRGEMQVAAQLRNWFL